MKTASTLTVLILGMLAGCRSTQTIGEIGTYGDFPEVASQVFTDPGVHPVGYLDDPDTNKQLLEAAEQADGDLQLAELEQLALANNPSLAGASAEIEALRGKWLQAGLPPNPVVGYTAAEIGNEGAAGQQGIFFGQESIRGGKLSLSQSVVAQEIETAIRVLSAQEQRVMTDVQLGYFDYLISSRRLALAGELVEVSKRAVRDTRELLQKGELRKAELYRAEAESATLVILLKNARNQKETTWKRLAMVVGDPQLVAPELDPTTVKGKLDEAVAVNINRDESIERLLSESPEIAATETNVERARQAIERANVEGVPNLNTQLSVQYDTATGHTVTGLQFGWPIPYYNWNQGGIHQAQSELVAAERAVDQVGLGLQRRFELVFQRYANARNQVEEYGKDEGILAKTKEMLRLTTLGYKSGEANSLDMLTAQRLYTQANLSHLEAVRELSVAAIEIKGLLLKDSDQERP
jgi:cobalt-zinc-cadmium efflux system outer membrane protein